MLTVIDNYDSFTYNLVQYLGELGAEMEVFRNDAIAPEEIAEHKPDAIVISPGPCTPREAGISIDVVRQYAGKVPILGVCLGHQSIGEAFGGNVVRADTLMHGKVSEIHHDGKDLFKGIPDPFIATRYHSLIVDRPTLPETILEVSAWTDTGVIMGLRHKQHPVYGVQFHPESILTKVGKKVLENFLRTSEIWNKKKKTAGSPGSGQGMHS
jgi:anthranilate synthase/aminodeoxychorismate synthase-like glutamine amidotransferase